MDSLEKLHAYIKEQIVDNERELVEMKAKLTVLYDMRNAVERELEIKKKEVSPKWS